MKTAGIYKIQQIGTDKCYVGSSSDIRKRRTQHLRELNRGEHCASYLQRSWFKYGADAFEFSTLEVCEPGQDLRDRLMQREQHWIDELKPCFNTCKAAGSTLGFKMPREIVERHRQQITGRKLAPEHAAIARTLALGLKRSEETKEKLRQAGRRNGIPPTAVEASVAARKGKPLTPEHKAKLAAASAGRKHSPEVIERMRAFSMKPEVRAAKSAAMRGKKQSPEHVQKRTKAGWETRRRNIEARKAAAFDEAQER